MNDSTLSYAHSSFAGLIGVGREDITPPVGIYARNWGAAQHDVAEGIHRPLFVTALTLQGQPDDKPCVLIAIDLGWWKTLEDEWYLRGGLIEALGLDPARVMINLSHTHACPSMCRDDKDMPGGHLIAPYLDRVREQTIQATRRALASAQPATLDWSAGRSSLATNRDQPDPDKDRLLIGFNPDAPTEDALLVGRATAEDGSTLATIVNYACHPTTLAWNNRLISPDFIGALYELVESHTNGAPCLFLQGASGELGPREGFTVGPEVVDMHGRHLGFDVLAVLQGMMPPRTRLQYSGVVESGAPIGTWKSVSAQPSSTLAAVQVKVELPIKADWPSVAEIEQQMAACDDRAIEERLRRKRRVRRVVGDGPLAPMPIWVWRVGDAILLGQPNEAYSWLQQELRRKFPERSVVVMNLSNGSCGYLPPPELYDVDIYQVWQTPFDRGSLELTLETCEKSVRQLLD
jgi:hypothetical protein